MGRDGRGVVLKKPASADVIELSRYQERRRASDGEETGTAEIVLFTGVRYERIETHARKSLREAL